MPREEQTVPFTGGNYEYRSRGVSQQVSVNLFPENTENKDSKVPQTLVHTPGSELVASIGTTSASECRGLYNSSTGPGGLSRLWGIFGNLLYRINSDLSYVEVGTVATGTGPVSITDNGFDLVVADGVGLYSADLDASDATVYSTYQQVDLPLIAETLEPIRPNQVVFLAQRLIINSQTNQFYFSELASTDFTDQYDVPNFYSAEQSADQIRAISVVNNRLWIFGDRSYEIWAATGDSSDNPLTFMAGNASQIGIQSARSQADIHNKIFWLGASDSGRNTIYMGSGLNEPMRISNNAIENELANTTNTEGAVGWAYYNEGHIFYVLTFNTDKKTLVYDLSTNLWHKRSTRDWLTTEDNEWDPQFGVTAYNKLFHGSTTSNRLLVLDSNKYTDWDDNPIVRKRVSSIYYNGFKRITARELLIDMEVGTTPLLQGLGRDPQVMLRVSTDSNTWINKNWRSIGSQGDYRREVKWSNLGAGNTITVELTFSDPSPITIYGARLRYETGRD